MAPADNLMTCLFCGATILEDILKFHIQYNHIIQKAPIAELLCQLHYPPIEQTKVKKLLKEYMVVGTRRRTSIASNTDDILVGKVNNKNKRKATDNMVAKTTLKKQKVGRPKKSESVSLEEPIDIADKIESSLISPEGKKDGIKKPIVLMKTTPTRKKLKKLLGNKTRMWEEDTPEVVIEDTTRNKKRKSIEYDDVYTRKENNEQQQRNIMKIRQLQQNDVQCIMDQGTYVQCTNNTCNKWRLVLEYLDPSEVPEDWTCSMNLDEENNDCSKGTGEDVEEDDDFVDVEFALGSMVWVKCPGYPWWPGMVDYCPDEEETFWIDPNGDSKTKVAKYHVVFFDKGPNVARGWVKRKDIQKMVDPNEPPTLGPFKTESVKRRFKTAKEMGIDAFGLSSMERIEKYSFATLFKGKWGDASDDSDDIDRRSPEDVIDPRLIGLESINPIKKRKKEKPKPTRKRTPKTKDRRKSLGVADDYSWERQFDCLKCKSKVKFARSFVKNHLRRHRMTMDEYLKMFDKKENAENLYQIRQWVLNEEYLNKLSENAKLRRENEGSGSYENNKFRRESDSSGASETAKLSGDSGEKISEKVAVPNQQLTATEKGDETPSESTMNINISEYHSEATENAAINNLDQQEVPAELCLESNLISETQMKEEVPDQLSEVDDGLFEEHHILENGGTTSDAEVDMSKDTGDENGEESDNDELQKRESISDQLLETATDLFEEPELVENQMNERTESDILLNTSSDTNNEIGEDMLEESTNTHKLQEKIPEKAIKSVNTPEKVPECESASTPELPLLTPELPLLSSIKTEKSYRVYPMPPMSPDVLIAIAVRNLDPHKHFGASCTDIVAFISLNFPHYNFNYQQCKEMVRKECGMSANFENGRENFQMKAEINCGDRIHTYVEGNKLRIHASMLEPEFLNIIIDRFVNEDAMINPSSRSPPPFDSKMLTLLALLKINFPVCMEQVAILIKFLFPSMSLPGCIDKWKRDLFEKVAKEKEISVEVDKTSSTSNIHFVIREEMKQEVEETIRSFSQNNIEQFKKSILSEDLIDVLVPGLTL